MLIVYGKITLLLCDIIYYSIMKIAFLLYEEWHITY